MIVIRSKYNFINVKEIANAAGVNPEMVSLRRAEGDGRLWRAWLSTEVGDIAKKEKDLLWSLICNGHEAVVMENNNKGWRRALR